MYVKLQTHASYIVYLMDFIQLCLAFTGWETANKYKITNTQAQQVFFAAEGTMIIHVITWFLPFLVLTLHNCLWLLQSRHASTKAINKFVDFAKYQATDISPFRFFLKGHLLQNAQVVLLAYERKFILFAMFLFELVHKAWPGLCVTWVLACR